MKTIKTPHRLKAEIRRFKKKGWRVGFVPTMGALHDGHLSLVKKSNKENDVTIVSIFVNPTQFGPNEDYQKYPRTLACDKRLLSRVKADILFVPSTEVMYPKSDLTRVDFKSYASLTNILCGKFRPGHFQGVLTVVAKLLNMVEPDRLYLGEKDYQQAVVIEKMIRDMHYPAKVRRVATYREKDGLAMSSRNKYLSSVQRKQALAISETLFEMKSLIKKKKIGPAEARKKALARLRGSVDKIQYLEVVDPVTLKPIRRRQSTMVAATACFVGQTRLIDNVIIRV